MQRRMARQIHVRAKNPDQIVVSLVERGKSPKPEMGAPQRTRQVDQRGDAEHEDDRGGEQVPAPALAVLAAEQALDADVQAQIRRVIEHVQERQIGCEDAVLVEAEHPGHDRGHQDAGQQVQRRGHHVQRVPPEHRAHRRADRVGCDRPRIDALGHQCRTADRPRIRRAPTPEHGPDRVRRPAARDRARRRAPVIFDRPGTGQWGFRTHPGDGRTGHPAARMLVGTVASAYLPQSSSPHRVGEAAAGTDRRARREASTVGAHAHAPIPTSGRRTVQPCQLGGDDPGTV